MGSRHGFTLVEMMVSVAIIGIVMIYVLQTFTTQQRTYVVVDQVSEIQQNSRAVADLLERDLRHAGFMVPESAALCGLDANAAPDRIFVSDADAVVPGDDTTPDFAAQLTGGFTNANGSQLISVASLVIEPAPPARPAYDTDGDGTNDSDFRVNGGAIITDAANPVRGAACGTVEAIPSATSLRVDIVSGGLGPMPPLGSPQQLVVVPAHEYQVNNQMQLLRDGLVLVEGVDDLQLALFFDGNDDGVVDPGEYLSDNVGADYVSGQVNGPDLREARFNLVLRTRDPDPRQQYNMGQFQNTENRAVVVGTDGFRRRVHTATVLLRNLGNRGVTL